MWNLKIKQANKTITDSERDQKDGDQREEWEIG